MAKNEFRIYNKSVLVNRIAALNNISKTAAKDSVNQVLQSISDLLVSASESEEDVKLILTGFGCFKVTETAERAGRNPKTGEAAVIPASRRVRFLAGATLKNAIKQTI